MVAVADRPLPCRDPDHLLGPFRDLPALLAGASSACSLDCFSDPVLLKRFPDLALLELGSKVANETDARLDNVLGPVAVRERDLEESKDGWEVRD